MKRISTIIATAVGFAVFAINASAYADEREASVTRTEALGFDLRIAIEEHPYPVRYGVAVD